MMTTNNLGLYLHIPFCIRKCKYCDFLSFACDDRKIYSQYAAALMAEIRIRGQRFPFRDVDSIYIGGGTPSLLSAWDMGAILDCIRENFHVTDRAEITVEANPATLTDEKLDRYLRKGVNRLSIGVQSFDNSILQTLGRIHNKNDAFYAYQRAKKAGFENINLDLMFGIPGQTMKVWKETVRQCIFLEPAHISLYSLQVEEGTPIYDLIRNGVLEPTPEIVDREMYHTALKMMKHAGYHQYEISNCARRGMESRHNLKYWSYEEYLGIGLGASSFADGSRFRNCSRMRDYIKALKASTEPIDVSTVEDFSKREEMGVFMFTGLRKADGVRLSVFRQLFGEDLFSVYDKSILNKYKGLLIYSGDRLYLSERGMDLSNQIMMEFV